MISGFQAIGDTGNFQVDSTFKNLSLLRKGSVNTSIYRRGNPTPTRASIILLPGEILAFSCPQLCTVTGVSSNTAFLNTPAGAGTPIDYYIFGQQSQGTNSGLQIFNQAGELTFDAGWGLFDVRDILIGHQNKGLPVGRKYAAVCSQVYSQVQYTKVVIPEPTGPTYFISYLRFANYTCVSINGNSISSQIGQVDTGYGPTYIGGDEQSYSHSYSNSATPIVLVIDVTNY